MRTLLLLTSVFIAMTIAPAVYAAGYGAAGCGLGSIVIGDNPGFAQVFAATTNGTSGSQTFGISSGTSNCDDAGIVLAHKEQEIFVEKNFASLSKEMAIGNGEHLTALSGLLGCPSAERARFATLTQEEYAVIFSSDTATPTEVLTAVRERISASPALATACAG